MGVAIGLKDGGGVNKPARARVKVTTNGDVFLNCALIEMGGVGTQPSARLSRRCLPVTRNGSSLLGLTLTPTL